MRQINSEGIIMSNVREYLFVGLVLASICVLGYLADYSTIYTVDGPPRYTVESVEWGIMDYRVYFYDSYSQADCGGVWTLSFFQLAVVFSVIILVIYLVKLIR